MKAIAAPQHSWQTLQKLASTQTATVKAMASSPQTLESIHFSNSLPLISLLVVTEAEKSIVGKRQGVSSFWRGRIWGEDEGVSSVLSEGGRHCCGTGDPCRWASCGGGKEVEPASVPWRPHTAVAQSPLCGGHGRWGWACPVLRGCEQFPGILPKVILKNHVLAHTFFIPCTFLKLAPTIFHYKS